MSGTTPTTGTSTNQVAAPAKPADTVNFMLNGKPVSVPKGTTVMQAAVREGAKIPHFCWHPGLSVAGVCRFCMVKIEGRPKLEIACNLTATEGMQVNTEIPEVKDSHKWALEFHLINHPLDCPICDQAGECGLQNYYMEVGKYESQMDRPKVLKPKALEVGKDLVLDTERCILCSRCVRFEAEVTKTDALGIFDRGDRAIVGTYPDKKIEHNYQTNLVDICPVGAFTSKDFRFKQRVWFLTDKPSVCPGCSTGCNVDVYAKPQTGHFYRLKPRFSDVNGHWMCDVGRHMYAHLNPEVRLKSSLVPGDKGARQSVPVEVGINTLARMISSASTGDIGLLISAQYTNEEYDALLKYFVKTKGVTKVFQWRNPAEKIDAFDGMLLRGDRNSNTAGLLAALKAYGLKGHDKPVNQLDEAVSSGVKILIALAPEIPESFPSLPDHLQKLGSIQTVSLWTLNASAAKASGIKHAVPMKGYAEKRGTLINYAGKKQVLDTPSRCGIEQAKDVCEVIGMLEGASTAQIGLN